MASIPGLLPERGSSAQVQYILRELDREEKGGMKDSRRKGWTLLVEVAKGVSFEALCQDLRASHVSTLPKLVSFCLEGMYEGDSSHLVPLGKVVRQCLSVMNETPLDAYYEAMVGNLETLMLKVLPNEVKLSSVGHGSRVAVVLACATELLACLQSGAPVYSNKRGLLELSTKSVLPCLCEWRSRLCAIHDITGQEEEMLVSAIEQGFDDVLTESLYGTPKYTEELGRRMGLQSSTTTKSSNSSSSSSSKSIYVEFFDSVCSVALTHDATDIPARMLRLYAVSRATVSESNKRRDATEPEGVSSLQRRQRICSLLQFALNLESALGSCCKADASMSLKGVRCRNAFLTTLSTELKGALPNHESMLTYINQLQAVSDGAVGALSREQARGDSEAAFLVEHLGCLEALLEIDHRVVLESSDIASDSNDGPNDTVSVKAGGDKVQKVLSAIVVASTQDDSMDAASAFFVRVVDTMGKLRRMHSFLYALVMVASDCDDGSMDVSTNALLGAPGNSDAVERWLSLLPSAQVAMCWPALFDRKIREDDEVDDKSDVSEEHHVHAVKTQTTLVSTLLAVSTFAHSTAPPFMLFLMDESLRSLNGVVKEDVMSFHEAVLMIMNLVGAAAKVIANTQYIEDWTDFIGLTRKVVTAGSGILEQQNKNAHDEGSAKKRKRERYDTKTDVSSRSTDELIDVARMVLTGYSLLFNVHSSWSQVQGTLRGKDSTDAWLVSHTEVLRTLKCVIDGASGCSSNILQCVNLLLSSAPIWVGAMRASDEKTLSEDIVARVAACLTGITLGDDEEEDIDSALIPAFNFCGSVMIANGSNNFLIDTLKLVVASQRPTGDAKTASLSEGFRIFFGQASPFILRCASFELFQELSELQRLLLDKNTSSSSGVIPKRARKNEMPQKEIIEPSDSGLADLDFLSSLICGTLGDALQDLGASLDDSILRNCMNTLVGILDGCGKALGQVPWTCVAASTVTRTLMATYITADNGDRISDLLVSNHECISHSAVMSMANLVLKSGAYGAALSFLKAEAERLPADFPKNIVTLLHIYCAVVQNMPDEDGPVVTVPEIWLVPPPLGVSSWWCVFEAQMKVRWVTGCCLEDAAAGQGLLNVFVCAISMITLEQAHVVQDNAIYIEESVRVVCRIASPELAGDLVRSVAAWFHEKTLDDDFALLTVIYAFSNGLSDWIGLNSTSADSVKALGRCFSSIPLKISEWQRVQTEKGVVLSDRYFEALLECTRMTDTVLAQVRKGFTRNSKTAKTTKSTRAADDIQSAWMTVCLQTVGQIAHMATKLSSTPTNVIADGRCIGLCVAVCKACFRLVENMAGSLVSIDVARSLACLTSPIQALLCALAICQDRLDRDVDTGAGQNEACDAVRNALSGTYSKASYVIGLVAHNHTAAKLSPAIMSALIHCISDIERQQGVAVPDSLLPGLLNLFDALSSRERKQVFNSLDATSRMTLTALQETWKNDYLFTGKA